MIKIDVSDNYDVMSRKAAALIACCINNKPQSLLCFPAGDSPLKVFQYLTEYARLKIVDFSQCTFVGLDEWVGLDENDEGGCKHFIYKNLFEPLHVSENQVCFFDACSDDLDVECERIDNYIFKHGPIDIMMLGIGLNGHVGFNEPGSDMSQYSHVTALDAITKTVGQKYFNKPVCLEKGISLGMRHILEAKMVIMIAGTANKAKIIKKIVEENPTEQVPASLLQSHENCYLFLDREAASGGKYCG